MVETGERLHWPAGIIVDKHCVGGLPGNRTTPLIVAIVTALGLTMPKTSSRAITSPAGTADAMETMAPVDLDTAAIRQVVEREGGCVVWGGAIKLSPADDILIRVERALDLDSEGQLIASVLSKKIAAGSTHIVIDLPVGPTAKVRGAKAAESLCRDIVSVAETFGLHVKTVTTDGREPVGRGIGPALEARDVLSVLRCEPDAPQDLRQRSIALAGALLELAGAAPADGGEALAAAALDDGRAWTKFQRICEAQGGMRTPPTSTQRRPLLAQQPGIVQAIDNRKIARLAKLAGAPDDKAAGVDLHVCIGDAITPQQPLCTVHAESPGELAYAFDYVAANPDIITVRAP
jgi:thymidine phosphorylase